MARPAKPQTTVENQNETIEQVNVQPEQPKRTITNDTFVDVMNNTTGTLYFKNSRTQAEWEIKDYGTIDQMQVSDLINMRSSSARILNEAWMLILDEDVVTYLRLNNVYENILKPEDMNNLFSTTEDKMKGIIEKAPEGMQLLIARTAREMIQNGNPQMDSVRKRKVIEDVLGCKLIDDDNE